MVQQRPYLAIIASYDRITDRSRTFQRGRREPLREGCQPTILPIFFQTPHENEGIFGPERGACPWRPLDSPMDHCCFFYISFVIMRRTKSIELTKNY